MPFEESEFWRDLREDLKDPEFREQFIDQSIRMMKSFHEDRLFTEQFDASFSEPTPVNEFTDCTGTVYQVHDPSDCAGDHCAIHNPSQHKMVGWPLLVRADSMFLIERLCTHGIGHPDPDSVKWLDRNFGKGFGIHGCDGCCRTSNPHVHKFEWADDDNGHSGSYCDCGEPEPDPVVKTGWGTSRPVCIFRNRPEHDHWNCVDCNPYGLDMEDIN